MHPSDLRRISSDQKWTVRALRCPDGITRLVTHQQVYWDTLDFLEREGFKTREQVIAFTWDVALAHESEGKTPDCVFVGCLTLTIYEFHSWLLQERYGLSNDNSESWVKHGPRQKKYPRPLIFQKIQSSTAIPKITTLAAVRSHMPSYRS